MTVTTPSVSGALQSGANFFEVLGELYHPLKKFLRGLGDRIVAGCFATAVAAIAFAYNSFDNRMMYGLIVLLFALVGGINTLLWKWEQRLYARRAGR